MSGHVLGVPPCAADQRGCERVLEGQPSEVQTRSTGHDASGVERPAVLADHGQVDPLEPLPEAGAPDHVGHVESATAVEHRPSRQQDRYGDRWAPVLLAWTTPEQDPRLRGDTAGIAGSVPESTGMSGDLRYVTGIVVLDAPQFRDLLRQVAGWERARAIVMHELGHLVGLAHVEDPLELMGERNMIPLEFGPGDLQGLATLGNGSCL